MGGTTAFQTVFSSIVLTFPVLEYTPFRTFAQVRPLGQTAQHGGVHRLVTPLADTGRAAAVWHRSNILCSNYS